MQTIKIKCPAKINLTLEIVNKREDGFHNIKSVMQLISLYDFLTIKITDSIDNKINLDGNSEDIPYNENNLVYKAAKLFLETANLKNKNINIYIEKNIPVSAGLAGGSTDAAGTLYGLNYITKLLSDRQIEELCAKLGSDLNVCKNGGCVLATSRGEITEPLPISNYDVTLIKPKNVGISAKEAYTKYAAKKNKPNYMMTEKTVNALRAGQDIKGFLYNDLEYAVFEDYPELQKIKDVYPEAIMSGSGSAYFVLGKIDKKLLDENYIYIENLKFIPDGVKEMI